MSNEPNNKIISLDRLAHYHSKLDNDVFTPLDEIISNTATNSDINSMFEGSSGEPDTVTFTNLAEGDTVYITDRNGNTISYDGSGSITLAEGNTYDIVISDSGSAYNKFITQFTPNGSNSLVILNPALMTSEDITSGNGYLSGQFYIYPEAELVFVTDKALKIRTIDTVPDQSSCMEITEYDYPGYLETGVYPQDAFRFSLYGSNDGLSWTKIASSSSQYYPFSKEGQPSQNSTYNIFVRGVFDDDNNPGYTHHKIVIDSMGYYAPSGKSMYGMWISEGYWVNQN